ncbi:MAG: SCO family protein [Alphaproteobacteria bacterium]|nr:SCO family protein [Alphaproteobacteria bacterium]
MLRTIRLAAWFLVVVVAVFTGAIWATRALKPVPEAVPISTALSQFGGTFSIPDMNGKRMTERDLAGRPSLMFFGFTYCPDVCPTTLTDISGWLDTLGEEAKDLAVYFISVDPERDTPEQLRDYLSAFDGRIMGLVGTPAETARIADAWRVVYKKVPQGDSYVIDHTATVFMVDKSGQFAGTIDFHEQRETALAKLSRLLRSAQNS